MPVVFRVPRVMQALKRLTRRQLDELRSELEVIAIWDECYQRSTEHSLAETDASEARRGRVREILAQLGREDGREIYFLEERLRGRASCLQSHAR